MHTIIRAIAYCAGWVAGLFRRADRLPRDSELEKIAADIERLQREVGDNIDLSKVAKPMPGWYVWNVSEQAEHDDMMKCIAGHANAMCERLERDEFGDAHDQVARGDG